MLHVPGYHRLWPGLPTCSATRAIGNSMVGWQSHLDGPATPNAQRLPAWHAFGLGSTPFRSPLLRGSRLLSLPPGTEMFQFPGFPEPALCVQTGLTGHNPSRVSPFGDPWIVGWLTPPQGLSQPPTSFIGSRCQGIHRVLLFTCRRDARARYGVLKDRRRVDSAAFRPSGRRFRSVTSDAWSRGTTLPQSCTRCPPSTRLPRPGHSPTRANPRGDPRAGDHGRRR